MTTCANTGQADAIARTVVEGRLAACVNILPQVRSVYTWDGAVQQEEELLLLIKTHRRRYPALEQAILDCHPYQVPEVIALPVVAGAKGYLDWVTQNSGVEQ